jgi:hypothetical protein
VETERGNLNFLSKNVEKGKNNIAIKKARKKGARMLCPNSIRYPIPIIEIITRVNFRRKGSLKKFITHNLFYKISKTH